MLFCQDLTLYLITTSVILVDDYHSSLQWWRSPYQNPPNLLLLLQTLTSSNIGPTNCSSISLYLRRACLNGGYPFPCNIITLESHLDVSEWTAYVRDALRPRFIRGVYPNIKKKEMSTNNGLTCRMPLFFPRKRSRLQARRLLELF